MERDHSFALHGCIEDLQASTLRLPVTGYATVSYILLKACLYLFICYCYTKNTYIVNNLQANIKSVKSAVYSAIQVMQTMGPSIHSTLSKVRFMSF